MKAGALEIDILANLARLQRDMDDAKKLVGGAMENIKKMAGIAAGALAALGVGLSIASFAGFIRNSINAADATKDMAAKMGVATKDVAGLQMAFKFSNMESGQMVAAIGKLSTNILTGSKAFDVLNVKTKDSAGQFRGTKDMLYELADKFAGMPDGVVKTALAMDIFGKSGIEMIPLLNDGAQGLKDMADMAERLGLVVDQDTAEAAASFNDTLDLISLSTQGVGSRIAKDLLPTLQSLTGSFFETLTEGDNLRQVSDFLSASMKILYSVAVGVVQIFSTLGKAIGAQAAATVAFFSGDFKGAMNIVRDAKDTVVSDWSATAGTIKKVWSDSGDAQVASMAKAVKQTKLNEEALKQYGGGAGKKAVDEITKAFEKMTEKLGKDNVKAAAEAEAAQHGYNKAQVEFLEVARSPEWSKWTEAQRMAIAALFDRKIAQEQATDATKKETEAQAEAIKALDTLLDGRLRAATEAEKAVETQRRENEALGLTGVALAQLQQARANDAATALERQAVLQQDVDLSGVTSEALMRQAAAMRELGALQVTGAGLEDSVSAVKELTESLDAAKAKSFGDALRDSFGEAGNALAQLANAYQEFSQKQAEIEKDRAKLEKVNDPAVRAALEIAVAKKSATAQIGAFASIAGAAKGFFKEHSKGYKAMQAAEQVFRAFEMALAMESMVKQIFGIGAVTAAELAAQKASDQAAYESLIQQLAFDQVEGQSKATVAVVTQATGDPYSAFVRMAAMVAAMAALGFAVGGGGGGGGASDEYKKPVTGTGTVLGMEGEVSESLGNAIDILADNSSIELTYTQRMLSELTKVREGIQGLAGEASSDYFIRGFASGMFGDQFLDSGIGFMPGQSVADIIERGVQGVGFNLIKPEKGGAQAMWSELSSDFKTGIGRVMGGVYDTIMAAADSLGLGGEDVAQRMLSLIPTLGDTSTYLANGIFTQGGGLVSLADKSGKEIQEELEGIFSAVGDQMAAAALPALKPFQRVGEGMFETLVRVTTGIESAEYALEQMGIQAIKYTDIIRTNGEIDTEIIRQSLMNAEAQDPNGPGWASGGQPTPMYADGKVPLTGVAQILDMFTGTAEELVSMYGQLSDVRNLMRSVGAEYIDLSAAMVRGAGGLDNLQSGLDSYLENYFTEQERAGAALARVTERAQGLGIELPGTTEAFREMVEGVDTSTAAGQMLFGQLMNLADGFYSARSAVDELAAAEAARAEEIAATRQGLELELLRATGRASEAVAIERAKELAALLALDPELVALQQQLYDLQDAATAAAAATAAQNAAATAYFRDLDAAARTVELTSQGTAALDAFFGAAGDAAATAAASASKAAADAAKQAASAWRGVENSIRSAIDTLRKEGLDWMTPDAGYAQTKADLDRSVIAALSGDVDAAGQVAELATGFLDASLRSSVSRTDYLRDRALAEIKMLSVLEKAEKEATVQEAIAAGADRTVSSLQAINTNLTGFAAQLFDVLSKNYQGADRGTAEQVAGQLALLQSDFEKWFQTNNKEGMATIGADGSATTRLAGNAAMFTGVDGHTTYMRATDSVLEVARRDPEIRALWEQAYGFKLPAYAKGGYHAGGWAMVGEQGPELAHFGASARIYNADDTLQMLGGSDDGGLVAELRELRGQVFRLESLLAEGNDDRRRGDAANVAAGRESGKQLKEVIENGAIRVIDVTEEMA